MSEMNKSVLKHVLIDTITKCVNVVEETILKQKIISLDCEGVMLSKDGRLTLMQVIIVNLDRFS
jgi:hypothetical protein